MANSMMELQTLTSMKITVVTPSHPARMANGMFAEAMMSVGTQSLQPAAISVAIDVDKEGSAPTRQRALDAATTEWVAFLDSDDLFLPMHLQVLAEHALETGADFVYSWFKVLTQDRRLLEEDPIFPPGHYLNPFDPDDPIETTITTLVRTGLAKEVGFKKLDRGEANSGDDRFFTMGILEAGGVISHVVAKTWIWRHHGRNSSGLPGKGDA